MPRRRIIGLAVGLLGAGVLVAVGVAIYDREASSLLLDLGIPGTLLTVLAGIALLLVGGATALRGTRKDEAGPP